MKYTTLVSVVLLLVGSTGCIFESFEPVGIYSPGPADMGEGDSGDSSVDATSTDSGQDSGPTDMGDNADAQADMSDAGDVPDMTDPIDMPVDMGCSNVIGPLPMTNGDVCQPKISDTPGMCDPVAQTGCLDGEMCDLQLVFSGGVPTAFSSKCISFDCNDRAKREGDSCSAGQCAPGFKCNSGTCKRYCQLEDSLGCAPGEGCSGSSVAREYGLCQAACG
jgi:hypothetical protein